MTFDQYSSRSGFDPVFSGSYDERFHYLPFPQNYQHGLYSFGSVSLQNVDLNYYPISTQNVPYSSFYGQSCPQIPYANQTVIHNRIQTDPWTNLCNGETYLPPMPDDCSQFLSNSIHDCYDVQRSYPLLEPSYSSFDSEYHVGCNIGINRQSSDTCFDNCGYVVASPSQMQHRQCPAYPYQHKEIVNRCTGDFTVPLSYSIDEIMRNTVASSTILTSENRNTFGIQSSLCDEHNMQQPTFGHCSPNKQLCASGQNLEANTRAHTVSDVPCYGADVTCVCKSESISHQSLVEISSFPSARRTLTDFAVNAGEDAGYAECMSSPSCMMLSSGTETLGCQVDTASTTSHGFVCRAVPEMRQSKEEPVTLTPSINISHTKSTGVESTYGEQVLSGYTITPEQTIMDVSGAIVDSTDVCEIPLKVDEQIGDSEVETSTSLFDAVAFSSSATSTTMEFRNCQLQADISEKSHTISPISSTLVIPPEMTVPNMANSRELMPDSTETAESCAVTRESVDTVSNASDDMIVLSPLPVADEPTAPVLTNPQNDAVKSCYRSIRPTCSVLERQNTDHRLRSILRPVVPHSHPVRLRCAGSHAVHRSSTLVPPRNRDFRNHDALPSCAKHIVNHNCSVQTTSCQRHLSCDAVLSIPTTSLQSSADITTCTSAKPMCSCRPVTTVCDSTPEVHQHSTQKELERLLHLTPSALKDELSKPRTSNVAVEHNYCYNTMENSQHTRLRKPSRPLPSFTRSLLQHGIAQNNVKKCVTSATAQYTSSISSSALSQILRAAGTKPTRNECMNYKSISLPVYRHDSSTLLLGRTSLRKSGTYSIRAAGTLLQHLKQAKLSDLMSARMARQQLLHRRLSLQSQNGAVIDLTGSDDGEEVEDETCELIFARTRRRTASMPFLRRPRQYFYGPHCSAKCRPTNRTFSVDRSLPFYRCFVQKLLRSYKFTSSGTPVKVYPPVPLSTSFASRGASSPADDHTHEELLKKRQPVVLLKKLDRSIENKNDAVKIKTSRYDVRDKRVLRSLTSTSNSSDKLHLGKSHIKDSRRQFDELVSLCRPVSVVLERLDRNEINQICEKLRKTEPCHSDNKSTMQLGTELPVSDLKWTVTLRPCANRLPMLVIRMSTQNASQKKMTKETSAHPTRQLRSSFKHLRTRNCTAGIPHPHNLASDCSESKISQKKMSRCRKLHFQSPTLKSLRSRNYTSSILCRRNSARMGRAPCRMSLKCSRKQSKSSKLSAKEAEIGQNISSKLTERFHEPEMLVTSIKQDMDVIPSDLTCKTSLLVDLLTHNLVVNENVPEDCRSSDSDTVALSPRSFMDADSTVDQDLHSVTSDSFRKNVLSSDLLPYNSVFDVDLPEDCGSSDSNTVALSPHSSIDDLTIAYRSPLSDVFDLDEPSLDQEEIFKGSLEVGNSSMAMDNDEEWKTVSCDDCSRVIFQPNTATVTDAMHSSTNLNDSCTFSESLSCGLVSANKAKCEGVQSIPVQLIDPVNDRVQKLASNNTLSEFINTEQTKSELADSVSTA